MSRIVVKIGSSSLTSGAAGWTATASMRSSTP